MALPTRPTPPFAGSAAQRSRHRHPSSPLASPYASVAFAPDGGTLAAAAWNNTIMLWWAAYGVPLGRLKGHTDEVWSVAFAPDGATVAAGVDDGAVRLWRVADGALLRTLEGHTRAVTSVAFASDGMILASGSWDGTVRLWGCSGEGRAARARAGHRRAPTDAGSVVHRHARGRVTGARRRMPDASSTGRGRGADPPYRLRLTPIPGIIRRSGIMARSVSR